MQSSADYQKKVQARATSVQLKAIAWSRTQVMSANSRDLRFSSRPTGLLCRSGFQLQLGQPKHALKSLFRYSTNAMELTEEHENSPFCAAAALPPFLTMHKFALGPDPCSSALRAIHQDACTVLFAISRYGKAVALSASLLRSLSIDLGECAALFLPRLRTTLRCILKNGTRRNAAARRELRDLVARIVFADAAWPELYKKNVACLKNFANNFALEMTTETWQLRRILHEARRALFSSVRNHRAEELGKHCWALLDRALAGTMTKVCQNRVGVVETCCKELCSKVAFILRSSRVTMTVNRLSAQEVNPKSSVTSRLRGGAFVRATLEMSSTGIAEYCTVIAQISNIGDIPLCTDGLYLRLLGQWTFTSIRAYLPASPAKPPLAVNQPTPTVCYKTNVAVQEHVDSDKVVVLWYLQTVV